MTVGHWVSQAVYAVAELGIPDLPKDGARSAAEIAASSNTNEDATYRLMRALSSEQDHIAAACSATSVVGRAGQHETAGSADLLVYFRQRPYISVPHELELTLSPILVLPTGDRKIAAQGYTHLGGEVLLGKGFGDLSNSPTLKYLRPLALQAEAGYTGRIQGPANSDVFGNLELEYSLEYLDHFVGRLNVGRPWVEFVPYVQFNYAQSFIASRLTTSPDFRLTTGIAYLGDYCELSLRTQIALDGAAPSGDRVAVLGLVEIFYDNIFPVLGRKPF